MRDFHKLQVWEKSHHLTLEIYQATARFPKSEAFGLTSQLRRACASIPANIAEGCGREGDGEFGRFLEFAMGSASEAEYHLLLARDLGYLDPSSYQRLNEQVVEVKKMLASFYKTLSPRRSSLKAET